MKKMMMIAATLLVAAVTRAASLNWGGGVMNSADAGQTAQVGTVCNLIYMGSSAVTLDGLSTYDKTTGLTNLGGTLMDTHTLTATEAENYAFADSFVRADSDGGVNGYWMVTIYDATTPTVFGATIYSVTGASDTTAAGTIVDETFTIGAAMQASVVPEPCAMALLVLGAAALGLKRKIA